MENEIKKDEYKPITMQDAMVLPGKDAALRLALTSNCTTYILDVLGGGPTKRETAIISTIRNILGGLLPDGNECALTSNLLAKKSGD